MERAIGLLAPAATIRIQYPFPDLPFGRGFGQSACRLELGQFTLEFAGSCEAILFADLPPPHVEQIRPLRLSHRKTQPSGREQLHALESETQHVHRVLGVEAVHLLEPWPVNALLSALTGQPLLLRLEVSEVRALNSTREMVLQIELRGNLAAMLGATVQTKRSSDSDDLSLQLSLVAGACNQRYLQLWSGAA